MEMFRPEALRISSNGEVPPYIFGLSSLKNGGETKGRGHPLTGYGETLICPRPLIS